MSAVKALQQWCRVRCDGYRDVSITNMTTSFRDGLAFCALLHHHRPDLIDFDSLKKDDVYENNKLAFRVAEDLGIPALLDAEDMVALKVPDRLSILTYVSQYYNYFHGRSPIGGMGGIKRPAGDPAGGPSGKKNQPVAAKVFPSSKPARENSPPPSSNITRAPPSPTPRGHATKDAAAADRPLQTGTLSNKCASCDKHVHLVQRHLVEGKLYHRSCAKTLAATSPTAAAPRSSPSNVPVSTSAPLADSGKTTAPTPAHTPSRLGPSWLTVKAGTSSPPSQPPSGVSPKGTRARVASKPAATTSINAGPVAAPRTSAAASKNLQSKLKFFQSERDEEKKPPPAFGAVLVSKRPDATAKVQEAAVGQPLSVVVNVGGLGRKEAGVGPSPGGDGAKAAGGGGLQKSKSSAAAFISKKLSEENNNNNAAKPPWATVALKKPDAPPQAETPRREPPGARGRKVLRADRSILDDVTAARTPSPVRPDRGGPRPNAAASENQAAPEDWRSKLKPIAKPAGPSQSSPKPWARGGGTPQTSEVSVRPSRSPKLHHPTVTVTPPAAKGFLNAANGTKSELKKMKPDYISKEDIIRELQEIEDNLNEWEKRGVELEVKLRGSEEEGEEDSLMDEVMVEWFNLIRNKQVAMRRESELVYIGKNQDLEEEQPTVEQELRRLMDKPDHLKTPQDRKRENQLMDKLVEIVNDRNAIVEGLDEDRLREDEEDQELNKMMMSFNIKKDKPKKKSPMSKLFNWGSKKEG